MDATEAANALLNRLVVLYGAPDTPDTAAFFREYRAMMEQYAPGIIEKAGDVIRDTHMRRTWPTPAEVREALTKAAPPPSRVDYDEIERERSMGWRFSDLNKSVGSTVTREEVQALINDWMKSIRDRDIASMDDSGVDFKRGQRDQFEEMQRNSPNTGMHRGKA